MGDFLLCTHCLDIYGEVAFLFIWSCIVCVFVSQTFCSGAFHLLCRICTERWIIFAIRRLLRMKLVGCCFAAATFATVLRHFF